LSEHLFEHVRPMLSAAMAERIAFLRAPRWIGTDAALAARRRLQALLERPPTLRTEGLLLVGPYANGKTMIAERFVLQHLGCRIDELDRPNARGNGPGAFLCERDRGIGRARERSPLGRALAEQVDALFRQLRPRLLSSTSSTMHCVVDRATSRRFSRSSGASAASTTSRRC
jgi:hypothetical protein